ncbi:MAG: NADH-quinone oxidoreductase subunit N [Chitinophagales bacterium]
MKFELMLTAIIFILLFLKIGNNRINTGNVLNLINILLIINLLAGFFGNAEGRLFGNMFMTNELLVLEKNLLNLGTFIISLQAYTWLKSHKHAIEFYILLLSTLMGMFFMISSQNILMFYLGLELSTIPLAALVNFDLEKRRSSEAAIKYIVSSAFSSGLLLLGISFLYGTTGSLNFTEISAQLQQTPLQIFAFILLIAGFGFKISAVPFHLWTADVYEGSPVAVTSYLSVVSKGAILFVFVSALYSVFASFQLLWSQMLTILIIITLIIGNLFAIRQNNIKRFLAFSSIAQVGFILVGMLGNSTEGNASVIYFILIYVFSNLGAFGVISVVSSATGKENIIDYKGFYKTNPLLAWALTICLFSLAGIPPTAGFFGKFFLIMAGAAEGNYILITTAALNMIVSLYYYLKIVKAMFMDVNDNPIESLQTDIYPKVALAICIAGVVITGFVGGCYDYIHSLL